MATYSKEVSKNAAGNEVVRFKKNGKTYIADEAVPEQVIASLKEQKPGVVVDELGETVETYNGKPIESDESENETPPTNTGTNKPEDDDSTDDDDDEEEEQPAPKRTRKTSTPRKSRAKKSDNSDDGRDDEEGMGFPRVDGKTVDLFDGKTPHTHVRPAFGLMVPLSAENYATKTDAEIKERLEELDLL